MKFNHGLLLLSFHPSSKRINYILKQACNLVQKTLYVDVQPWKDNSLTRMQLHRVMEVAYGKDMNNNNIDVRLLLSSSMSCRKLSRPISLFILEQGMSTEVMDRLHSRYEVLEEGIGVVPVQVDEINDGDASEDVGEFKVFF